jgi:hypothetical protein
MADDVKVKFGGDFADIAKGAGAAAKYAGNAFMGSMDKFSEGMMGSITSAISVENIVSKIKEGLKEASEYFKEIGKGAKTAGVSPSEVQRVLALGKPQGISSIETISKALGIYSQNISLAAKGSEKHRAVLRELGFTQDEITSGTITATEALAALAKQNEGPQKSHMAANLAALFGGKSGKELKGIVSAGSTYIKDILAEAKIFSDAEVEVTEAAERGRERFAGKSKKVFRSVKVDEDFKYAAGVIADTATETREQMEKEGTLKDDVSGSKFIELMIRKLKAKGFTPKAAGAVLDAMENGLINASLGKSMSMGQFPFATQEGRDELRKQMLRSISQAESETPAPEITSRIALTASSLQAIGGGDVNSVMAASYQAEMLDATKQVAENTRKLVEGTTPGAQPPAKAGR